MLDKSPLELKVADLDRLYLESDTCDKRLFSEMRTNLQLVAGEHYVREGSKYWNRIRDVKQLTDESRLRLVKNHIQRVVKTYENAIQAAAPGVTALPKDERDIHHQKSAEMHASVIQSWKGPDQNWGRRVETWIKNFFEMGECICKVFWESEGGNILGHHPDFIDDEQTEANPQAGRPIYAGKLVFETIAGFLLKRDPSIPSLDESPYLIYVKMISKSVLRAKCDENTFKEVAKGSSFEYTVYDTNTGTYRNTKDQVLYKEIYFRPNPMVPQGYFYHWVTGQILAQGELPYGLFPIVFEPCEEQTGNPRGISPIRHLRPVQIELNRAASKIAEHQVTLGDDKVYIQSTTKLSQGAVLPGIRVNQYTGKDPIVVPGRAGDQYFPYLEMQKKELYEIGNLEEMLQEPDSQVDIYTQLFRSLRYKKKFTIYSDRFERFLTNVAMLGLKLTKESAHPDQVIPMIGKSEQLNMAEFKTMDDLSHQIKVEPRADDIESQFGKQIVMNHLLQYVGNQLGKEDIGKLMRLSPFLNEEQAFEDFTIDYDSTTNDILALDRGQMRPARPQDNHDYVMKRINARMKKPDFEFLNPQVQQLYAMKLQQHEQLKAQQLQALKQAESEFIPSGGYLAAVDMYSNDPKDPMATRRIRLPSESLSWLIQMLAKQGTELQELQNMPGNVLSDMAQQIGQAPGVSQGGSPPVLPHSPQGQSQGPMGAMNGHGTNGTGGRGNDAVLGLISKYVH